MTFDERSLDAYWAAHDQCWVVIHAYEQACHARASLEAPEGDASEVLAKASLAEYAGQLAHLQHLIEDAEARQVPVGQIQAMIVVTLPAEVQQDIFELATT